MKKVTLSLIGFVLICAFTFACQDKLTMEEQLKKIVYAEFTNHAEEAFIRKICDEYFEYYFGQSADLQNNLSKLLQKYTSETILGFLGENSYPKDYTHLSLGHSMTEKSLYPMLDNGGGIYPVDKEIGQLCVDPQIRGKDESDQKMLLRYRYHGIIFYSWLAINWIAVEGYKSGIVVKTTENNSVTSFFLNDFEFDNHSKFENEADWKGAIEKYNLQTIEVEKLVQNVKKNFKE